MSLRTRSLASLTSKEGSEEEEKRERNGNGFYPVVLGVEQHSSMGGRAFFEHC